MTVALNGIKIKGSNLKVAATLPLAGEDISGQSSYAAMAETGDKPKALSVSLDIAYKNAADLTDLVNLAEAKNDKGERETYQIINATAKAMTIRQVRFQGDFLAREDDSTELWHVAFKLTEIKSVPEIKEARQTAQTVTDAAPEGETVEAMDVAVPEVADLSTFENVLKWADDALADEESTA